MSSIIAVKAYTDENCCIYFAADRQETTYDGDKALAKGTRNKIWTGPNWVLAYAGTATEHLDELRKKLVGRRKVGGEEWGIEKATEMITHAVNSGTNGNKRTFPEFFYTVTQRMRRERYDVEDSPDYLFATNNPLELFYIDESGNMFTYNEFCKAEKEDPGELEYLLIGSGSREMKKYIQEKFGDDDGGKYIQRFDIAHAPSELIEIIRRPGEVDINTGWPVSLAAITKKQVFDIRERLARAARRGELEEAEDIGIEVQDSLDSASEKT
mgnify:CR=1 FL=1